MHLPRTDQYIDRINDLYAKVPEYKQRIAGKSIPMEKFSVSKAKKHMEHGTENMLAGVVSFCLFENFDFLVLIFSCPYKLLAASEGIVELIELYNAYNTNSAINVLFSLKWIKRISLST